MVQRAVSSSILPTGGRMGRGHDEIECSRLILCTPRKALMDLDISTLFRHYTEVLAPWYDLCDEDRHFGRVVSARSLDNPVLFKAIIAFSAKHKEKTSGGAEEMGLAFHGACVRDMLAVVDDFDSSLRGEYLAATCLLRSYEIMIGDPRKEQRHLLGAYSFSASETTDMNAKGLVQSGVWNYLREEITVALECRRCTRNSIHFVFDPSLDYPDSMRANIMSHILARVINHCFQNGAVEQHSVDERIRVQEALHRALDEWRESLPPSFEPFSAAAVATNSPFPSIWLLQPWHVAAMQYYHVAQLLLYSHDPSGHDHTAAVQHAALTICGLARTNNDVAATVNAFGPLAFCGRYLNLGAQRSCLIDMLREFVSDTGWPVHCIIADLEKHWSSCS